MKLVIPKKFPLTTVTRQASWWNHPGHKEFKNKLLEQDHSLYIELNKDRYVKESIYPEITPKYPPGSDWGSMDVKRAWMYHQLGGEFDQLTTVPERMAALAYENCRVLPDVYGKLKIFRRHIFQLEGLCKGARSLPMLQYLTNTHIRPWSELPEKWLSREIDQADIDRVQESFECPATDDRGKFASDCEHVDPGKFIADSIRQEAELEEDEQGIRDRIASMLRRTANFGTLDDVNISFDVPIAAYWKRGGFGKLNEVVKGGEYTGDEIRAFQFNEKAAGQMKMKAPLPDVVPMDYAKTKFGAVPYRVHHPSFFRVFPEKSLPMQIPGHWYGSAHPFNLLTMYSTQTVDYHCSKRHSWPEELRQDALSAWAMTTGHAELTAQAYLLGFSMWKRDLTYPMVAQLALVSKTCWVFAVYQLNSIQLFKSPDAYVLPNLCWITEPISDSRKAAEIILRMQLKEADFRSRIYTPYCVNPNELEGERHIQLARQLYDSCRHAREQTMFDSPKVHGMTTGTDYHKRYSAVCSRFREVVREQYPKRFWGHELQKIDRIRSHPTEHNYDKLKPNERTHLWFDY